MNNRNSITTPTILVVAKKEIQAFVRSHENDDERELVLAHKLIHGVPAGLVADQISGRRKARFKLPLWYQTEGIVYPPPLNLEQASSQHTAQIKAELLTSAASGKPGKQGSDLSSGYGVDSFYLSLACENLDCIEVDQSLIEMSQHNHRALGVTNIRYYSITAEAFLNSLNARRDFVFIDPSRRKRQQKVFKFADCEPNVIGLLPSILKITDKLLIKASPLIDLQQGGMELGSVEKIFVVAVDHECKEVLFLCTRNPVSEPTIVCLDRYSRSAKVCDDFTFTFSEEKRAVSDFSDPLTFIYEPSAAILKAGAFKLVGNRYGLSKLQPSTHLYTSDKLIENFPGRIFRIEQQELSPHKPETFLADRKVNVVTRNYPLSPEQIKKKYKLKDGGENYLIGFSGVSQKFLVTATRLK